MLIYLKWLQLHPPIHWSLDHFSNVCDVSNVRTFQNQGLGWIKTQTSESEAPDKPQKIINDQDNIIHDNSCLCAAFYSV